jgi:hypothetical protein
MARIDTKKRKGQKKLFQFFTGDGPKESFKANIRSIEMKNFRERLDNR